MTRNIVQRASCIMHHAPRLTPHPYKSRLLILLAAFALLGLAYSVTTPVFEAPDETWHYNYLRYIAEGQGLPSLLNNDHGAYQEAAQPPLYYALAALVTAPVRDDDRRELMWHNPGFGYQSEGTSNDNKNMLIHTGRENWPWRDFTLALHLARLVSLAWGVLAVFATWGLARAALPGRPNLALAAAGAAACMPQFVFMSGVASNDSAAAALSTAALWSILRMAQRPAARRAALTGALIGLAWLTKTSTLLLLPLAILFIIFHASRFTFHFPPSTFHLPPSTLRHLAVMTGTTLLAGGWWYARNLVLYGDALGLSAHVNTPWGRPEPLPLIGVLSELPLLYRSFWGAFGWGGIELPAWVYVTFGLLALASLTGWLLPLVTRHSSLHLPPSTFIFLLLWCAAILAALLRWMTQVQAPHGRLLFPAIGAWSVLLVAGWARLGQRAGRVLTLSALGLLGSAALYSPWVIIRPALLPPPALTEAQVRARADATGLTYGGLAKLAGYKLAQPAARPGDTIPVTLCWQALQPMSSDYSVFVHFLGQDNLIVGQRDTWPGLGRFPTRLWKPGQPFCDIMRVRVEPWAPAPALYAVEVGLYDAPSGARLETPDPSLPIAGVLIVRGPPPPTPQHSVHYDLDAKIKLIGYDAPAQAQAGQPFSLTLHWQAEAAPLQDYVVFVHALDANGRLAAQSDAPPRNDQYPTSVWAKGEVIADTHTLTLPAGLYTLGVGMYHSSTQDRLPIRGPEELVQNDIIRLTTIQIMP